MAPLARHARGCRQPAAVAFVLLPHLVPEGEAGTPWALADLGLRGLSAAAPVAAGRSQQERALALGVFLYSPGDQLFARAKDGSTISIIIRCAKILFAHVLRFQ